MKILQVCHHFRPCIGGIERHVEELSLQMRALGHTSDVLCLNACSRKGEELPSREEYKGIRIHRVPYLDLGIYKVARGFWRLLEPYDLLHVHGLGFFSDFLSLTRPLHRKPLVLSTHGGVFHTRRFAPLKALYFHLLCRGTLRGYDRIIAVSREDEALFSRISARVMHIPNGIRFEELPLPKEGKDGRSFLFVGRLSRNKRVDLLLRTFRHLVEEVPDGRLTLVGGDWEGLRGELEETVEELGLGGTVTFAGEVQGEALKRYYQSSQFFVSASEYEGFGLSALEAMASGLVPLLSDIPAHRELLREGKEGFLLDFRDPRGAARRTAAILREARLEEIRKNARERARKFDWKEVRREVEKVYQAACSIGQREEVPG
jgi:alpha-1,3-mannosyltransferase